MPALRPSPVVVDEDLLTACRAAGLSSPAIVEVVTWTAVLQMHHRLSCFHRIR